MSTWTILLALVTVLNLIMNVVVALDISGIWAELSRRGLLSPQGHKHHYNRIHAYFEYGTGKGGVTLMRCECGKVKETS